MSDFRLPTMSPSSSRRVLVIDAHPRAGSLTGALADHYAQAADQAGHAVQRIALRDLGLQLDLSQGYAQLPEPEPGLLRLQQAIVQAQHLVWAFPVWWGSVPALLKGTLDRALLPGFAFRYHPGQLRVEPLLGGRSARLLVCMDTPPWFYRWVQRAPALHMMRRTVLGFVGMRPVRASTFGPVINSRPPERERWLAIARRLGAAAL